METPDPIQTFPRVLVTAFKPFARFRKNPSELVIENLREELRVELILDTEVLDVSFEACRNFISRLKSNRIYRKYNTIIMMGLNARTRCIQLERVALNIESTQYPDNEGDCPVDRKISTHGPDGIFTTLPIHDYYDVLNKAEYSSQISNSAGTFVCNSLFYRMMCMINRTKIQAGFIHLPMISRLWTRKRMTSAIKLLINYGLDTRLKL
jgi:pyroglutamyl-peptidase